MNLTTATIAVAILVGGPAFAHLPNEVHGSIGDEGTTVVATKSGQGPKAGSAGGSVPGGTPQGGGVTATSVYTKYNNVPACGAYSATNFSTDLCQQAIDLCKGQPGVGYMTYTYGFDPDPAVGWKLIGHSCNPDALIAQAQAAQPQLTLADIQREFHNTPFATPTGTMQPPDNQTLVTLPVYFQMTWPAGGYRPGQTRTVTLLGHTVDLAIKLDHYTYDHGDGSSTGPTQSQGGPYPTGDVTHRYDAPGTYTPSVTAVLTADYRVDGGAWQPINGTAARTGSYPALTVHTATNRLRADGPTG